MIGNQFALPVTAEIELSTIAVGALDAVAGEIQLGGELTDVASNGAETQMQTADSDILENQALIVGFHDFADLHDQNVGGLFSARIVGSHDLDHLDRGLFDGAVAALGLLELNLRDLVLKIFFYISFLRSYMQLLKISSCI